MPRTKRVNIEELIEDFLGDQTRYIYTLHKRIEREGYNECYEYNVAERRSYGYSLLPYSLIQCEKQVGPNIKRIRIEIIDNDNDKLMLSKEFDMQA